MHRLQAEALRDFVRTNKLRLLLAVVALAWPAAATRAAAAPEPFWQKACDRDAEGKPCWVEQFAISMPDRTIVLRVRFSHQSDGKTRMVASAPLGISLPPGLRIALDGSVPLNLPFERCSAQGCDAISVLDRSAMDKFVKGKSVIMHYEVSDKASANIPIRLEGLADALDTLPR